jgi:hypothetical protein
MGTLAICLSLCHAACDLLPPWRPAGVPEAAVRVNMARNAGWVHCWLDVRERLNKCRIYNNQGVILRHGHEESRDDVFLPYRRKGPVAEEELDIDLQRTSTSYVALRDGTFLVPRERYSATVAFIEEMW